MKLSAHLPINLTSYGVVARNLLTELSKLKVDISLFPIGQINYETHGEYLLIKKCIELAKFFSSDCPHLRLFHQFSLAERVGKGPLWGFPIWEVDSFSPLERHHIEQCDGLLVASTWGKNVVLQNTNQKNVHTVPLGANPDIFKPLNLPRQDDIFKILCCGKIELRKLHDIIPDIFAKAFNKSDNVELLMSWSNPFCSSHEILEWEHFYKTSPLGEKIKFIPRITSSIELNKLYNSVDTLLTISRAEGAGLPAIEMLQIGKPIIFVEYGGITEYLNNHNALPIKINNLIPAIDGKFFVPGTETNQGMWADFGEDQIEQCVTYLRKLYKERKEYQPIVTKFTWKNSAKKLIEIIFGVLDV